MREHAPAHRPAPSPRPSLLDSCRTNTNTNTDTDTHAGDVQLRPQAGISASAASPNRPTTAPPSNPPVAAPSKPSRLSTRNGAVAPNAEKPQVTTGGLLRPGPWITVSPAPAQLPDSRSHGHPARSMSYVIIHPSIPPSLHPSIQLSIHRTHLSSAILSSSQREPGAVMWAPGLRRRRHPTSDCRVPHHGPPRSHRWSDHVEPYAPWGEGGDVETHEGPRTSMHFVRWVSFLPQHSTASRCVDEPTPQRAS